MTDGFGGKALGEMKSEIVFHIRQVDVPERSQLRYDPRCPRCMAYGVSEVSSTPPRLTWDSIICAPVEIRHPR